jgi:hypothetical protein
VADTTKSAAALDDEEDDMDLDALAQVHWCTATCTALYCTALDCAVL